MCGIAGYFDPTLERPGREGLLTRMCGQMIHRGPDDEGFFENAWVGLGMRRLSIIDLEGGHQPISVEGGAARIVFNGEIYNYRQLRADLEKQGHRFQTQSDTEVILRQYLQEGSACVHRLNGMFSFALWDERRKQLLLARDRLGVKPLYYAWDGRRLLFASEIKAILAAGSVRRTLNEKALWDYLTFRYVPQPDTIWSGIRKLRPGHHLTLSLDRPEPVIERYWTIPYEENNAAPRRMEEYREELEELLQDAVRLRLIADVPVGILLSGGLDSSVVAALAVRHHPSPHTFSVAFKDSPESDERPFARRVSSHLGTQHHEVLVGEQDVLDFLPSMVQLTDEPLSDLPCVALYYLCKLARERVKVVLSGEGADEVLGGYRLDRLARRHAMRHWFQRVPSPIREGLLPSMGRLLGQGVEARIHRANLPGDRFARPVAMNYCLSTQEKRAIWRVEDELPDSLDREEMELEKSAIRDPIHQTLYVYCQSWLADDILMKADRMSMANSLELRTPYLDYRIVEWAARAPSWIKVGTAGGWSFKTKRILREVAHPLLPREIIERPKRGFPVPLFDWLGDRLKPWAFEMLDTPTAQVHRWLHPEAVRRQLALGTSSPSRIEQVRLWNLLILELWAREWKPE